MIRWPRAARRAVIPIHQSQANHYDVGHGISCQAAVEIHHLDCGQRSLCAFAARLGTGSLNGLFTILRGNDAKRHGEVDLHAHLRNAFGRLASDEVEVDGAASNQAAQTDDAIIPS